LAGSARRLSGAVALSASLLLGGTLLAGCAASHASALARQACGYVSRAEHLRVEAGTAAADEHASLLARADHELELAAPLAAVAAGDDPTWQALSANLAEIDRVPTSLVMPAIRADCSKAALAGS
jgi:hypothetical protein